MPNVIEISKSNRASCRSCRQKIDKGVLRFGEEIPNAFNPEAGMSHAWHHLACVAKKHPELLRPALDAYPGEVPERAELERLMTSVHPQAAKGFPYAERAPTARSKCMACGEGIEKGDWRVAVEREVDTGAFTASGAGYLHAECAQEHVQDPELMAKLKAHGAALSPVDLNELERLVQA